MSTIASWNYEDCKDLVHYVSEKYRRKYQSTNIDWLSEANLAFMEAHRTFNPSKGVKFSTWLFNILNMRLLDVVRYRSRDSAVKKAMTNADFSHLHSRTPVFSYKNTKQLYKEWKEELSVDARMIVDIVVDPPLAVLMAVYSESESTSYPKRLKSAVVEFLEDLGWCSEEIFCCFDEITEALR